MTRAVAFIPARAGSKRIPRKNLREVNGRSLLDRAIDSARACGAAVIVSTEDAGIRKAALDRGVAVHDRPASLATDDARVEDAISHLLHSGMPERLTRALGLGDEPPDVIVVLQPTSPLRTAVHVREALALMERTKADTCVSVCVSNTHHFASALRCVCGVPPEAHGGDGDACAPLWRSPRLSLASRTQDLALIAHENGAIYAVTREHFQRHGLHGGRSVAYVMDALDSVDVDEPRDLYLAAMYEHVRYQEMHGVDLAALAVDGIDGVEERTRQEAYGARDYRE